MSRRTERWMEQADRLEDYWRDFAFLGLNEELRISGFRQNEQNLQNGSAGKWNRIEVRLLTLRMFIELCAVRSPFMVGGSIGPEHVAQVLWRLSPEYDRRKEPAEPTPEEVEAGIQPTVRSRYMQFIGSISFRPAVRAIVRYLDRMLIDKPPSAGKSKTSTKPDTSFAASMIHQLANAYGWSDDVILDIPMPRLFQYIRKIHRQQDPELSYFNPIRDRFVNRITNKVLAQRKKDRELSTELTE